MDNYDPLPDCTFGQAIARFFKKYVQFKGAASRSEFWWAFLFTVGVGIILRLMSLPCHVLVILAYLWDWPSSYLTFPSRAEGFMTEDFQGSLAGSTLSRFWEA